MRNCIKRAFSIVVIGKIVVRWYNYILRKTCLIQIELKSTNL